MPEENAPNGVADAGERAKFEPAEIGPLESRLTPEQIADLDAMNARVFGGNQEPQPPVPPAAPTPPAEPLPPVQPKAPTAPVAPPVIDEFTPPDDAVTPPAVPESPTEEFPDSKTIFPDEAIEKLRTEKSKGDIRGLREHYENAVKTLKERTKELEEVKKKVSPAEHDALVEDLKRRNAELNLIVEQESIKRHPWYQATFVQPRAQLVSIAEKALEMGDLPKENLKKALGMSDSRERIAAFDELFESVQSPTLRAKLESAISQIDALDEKNAMFLADREGNSAKMLAQQKAQEHENLKRQETFIKESLDRTFEFLGQKSPFFRKSGKPGWEKWDAAMDADRAEAEELALRNEDPLKLVGVITAGVRLNRVLAAYDRQKQTIADLNKTIEEMRGSRPSINGDRIETPSTPGAVDPNEDLVGAGRRTIHEITAGY